MKGICIEPTLLTTQDRSLKLEQGVVYDLRLNYEKDRYLIDTPKGEVMAYLGRFRLLYFSDYYAALRD